MKKEAYIELVGISTGYNGKHGRRIISSDIDANVYKGELTCLIGANGAGKSTLLYTMCGFIKPLAGDVYVESKHISDYNNEQIARKVAIVLTEKSAIKNMTVYEMVAMGRSPYTDFWGRIGEEDRLCIDKALKLVGIDRLSHRMIDRLSDGERQKVMIARALAQDTEVIFLDEPTAFLDYPSKVEVMKLLRYLAHQSGKAIFMTTHDLELALQISDKIWLLKRHEKLIIGMPEDLALQGEFDHFFDNDSVEFDRDKSIYAIRHHSSCFVEIDFDGTMANLMRKALIRYGIDIGQSKIKISLADNPKTVFHILDDGVLVAEAGSFEELINKIKPLVLR